MLFYECHETITWQRSTSVSTTQRILFNDEPEMVTN